jgi:hypothetical protein
MAPFGAARGAVEVDVQYEVPFFIGLAARLRARVA